MRSRWIQWQSYVTIVLLITFILSEANGSKECSFDVINAENVRIFYKLMEISVDDIEQSFLSGMTFLQYQQKREIRKIEITNQTDFTLLNETTIVNFPRLEKVTLSANAIETVRAGAFVNLPYLTHVHLCDNNLASMDFGVFVQTPKLLRLHLDRNRFIHFDQLWLGHVPSLEWLSLEYNLLETVPTASFSNFPQLTYINLGHNQIADIDGYAFYGLDELEILDLSYNQIKYLHDDIFLATPNLRILNLYYNQLSYLSDSVLRSLSQINEFITLFNPWQCGCYKKMEQWAKGKGVRLNKSKYLNCAKVEDVSDIPKSVCSQDHNCNTETAQCIESRDSSLCDKLYSNSEDFECAFEYAKYIDV